MPPAQPVASKAEAQSRGVGSSAVAQRQRIMGRTKLNSVELENKPADSHVARTDQDEFGHIFRRNMPYGTVETMAPCSLDSAQTRSGFRECSTAWQA